MDSSNVEPLLLGNADADGDVVAPNPAVITIADIFKGPLEDEQPVQGGDVPAPVDTLLQGAPGALPHTPAVPPVVVPDSGDDAGY